MDETDSDQEVVVEGKKEGEICDVVHEDSVGVVLIASVISAMREEVESLVLGPVDNSTYIEASSEPVMGVPAEEVAPVLCTSSVTVVGMSELTVPVFVVELVCRDLLASMVLLRVEVTGFVLSDLGTDVEAVVIPLLIELTHRDVGLDDCDSATTEELDSCPEVVGPT